MDYILLKESIINLQKLDEHIDYLNNIGMEIEGKILQPLISYYDKQIKLLDSYINIYEEVSYFIYECKYGKDPKVIIMDNKQYLINSIDSFIDYLKEVNK